jgi:hypothetical protein
MVRTSSPSRTGIVKEQGHVRQNEVENVPHHGVTREGVLEKKSMDTKSGITWEERFLALTHDRLLIAKVKCTE